MGKKPLLSFCIATYNRPQFIKSTLEIILKQKGNDYEIIISEDPSANTAEDVINSFKSNKIFYFKNKKTLGMVKSYIKAVKAANGKFITVLADDDPPTDDMLDVFRKNLSKYPSEKAFFGASAVKISTREIEKVTHLKIGLHSLVNKNKKHGSAQILKPKHFFKEFLKQEIFPHYQWTASVIAKDILEDIHFVPDYNSPHFIDYSYLLQIAYNNNFVIINKELAIFELQPLSYGKKEGPLDEYKRGVIGFDTTVAQLAKNLGYEKEYQNFLARYIIMFLVNRLDYYKKCKLKIDPRQLYNDYIDLCKTLAFLKNYKKELYWKLFFYYRYSTVHQAINFARRFYGKIKIA